MESGKKHLRLVTDDGSREQSDNAPVLPENVKDMGEFYSVSFGIQSFVIEKNLSSDDLNVVLIALGKAKDAFDSGDEEKFKMYLDFVFGVLKDASFVDNQSSKIPTKTISLGNVILRVREDLSRADIKTLRLAEEAYKSGDKQKFDTFVKLIKITQETD